MELSDFYYLISSIVEVIQIAKILFGIAKNIILGGASIGRKMKMLKREAQRLEQRESEVYERERKCSADVLHWLIAVVMVEKEILALEEQFEKREWRPWKLMQHVRLMNNTVDNLTPRVTELLEKKFEAAHQLPVPEEAQDTEFGHAAFRNNLDRITNFVKNGQKSKMGIHGMRGSGKTILVTHTYNLLVGRRVLNLPEEAPLCPRERLEQRLRFLEEEAKRNVTPHFLTVSEGCGVYQLQEKIAKSLGVDISDEQDEVLRAGTLLRTWKRQKEAVLLILDDVCTHFSLHQLGLSLDFKELNFKLIVTSPSETVCRRMFCDDELIEVNPLCHDEAWRLFKRVLRSNDFHPGVESIAEDVASECGGLPLKIVKMSTKMRGIRDAEAWKDALKICRTQTYPYRRVRHRMCCDDELIEVKPLFNENTWNLVERIAIGTCLASIVLTRVPRFWRYIG